MPESIHTQFLGEIQQRIASLSLDGLDARAIAVRSEPWDEKNCQVGVTVWEMGETSGSPFGQPVNAEDIGYVCGVAMVRHRPGDSAANIDHIPLWRRAIRKVFNQKRMTTPAPVGDCNIISTVHPLDLKPPNKTAWDQTQYKRAFWKVICWVREQRSTN